MFLRTTVLFSSLLAGAVGCGTAESSSAPAPLAVDSYTRFVDPSENAFSMEVPNGWTAVGSLTRRGALEISPFVRALSSDKMTYLMVGEPTLLTYTPPSPVTTRLGWREGSLHSSGLGGVTMLMHYLPGAQFAKLYGQTALAGLCPQMRLEGVVERPDFAQAVDQAVPTVIPSISNGGEASFSCRHGGNEMEVRVDAVTRADRNNIMWNVIFLRAFIAPRSQADAAQEILKHMTLSFRYDPNWVQRQNQISHLSAQMIQQQVLQAERAEQGVIAKLNATDENFTNMDDIVSGYSTYRDDQTGQTYKLGNTNPGKWVGDGGHILATPDNNPPLWNPSARALTRVD
jgi:hypothetical protein